MKRSVIASQLYLLRVPIPLPVTYILLPIFYRSHGSHDSATGQASGSTPSGLGDTLATVFGTPNRKRSHEEAVRDDARSTGVDDDVEILNPTLLSTVPGEQSAPSGLFAPPSRSRLEKGKLSRPNLRVTSNASEIESLWHKDFPFTVIIDQYLTRPKDEMRKLTTLACQIACMPCKRTAYGWRVSPG